MKKRNYMRIICAVILWLLVISWMAFIFIMSSQEASESSKSSGGIIEIILKTIKKDYNKLPQETKDELIESMQFAVRKLAHFSAYALLGILSFWALYSTFSPKGKKLWCYTVLSLSVGLIFAASDEWHQYFVPGRSCEFRDVMIDFSGVCLGVGWSLLVFFIAKRIAKSKAHKK